MKANIRKTLIIMLVLVLTVSVAAGIVQIIDYKKADKAYADATELAGLPDFSDIEAFEASLAQLQSPMQQPQSNAGSNGGNAPEESVSTDESDEPVNLAVPQQPDGQNSPAASSPAETGTSLGGESADNSNNSNVSGTPTITPPVYDDSYAEALSKMDFAALRAVNDDVMGWIMIPGTNISYPLMDASDNNNNYYLNHNWRGGTSSAGAIFLDSRNSSGLWDFNSVIYGHRMNNESMFAHLLAYRYSAFWSNHPSFYINTDSGCLTYRVFAVYEADITTDLTYDISFGSDEAKQEYIDYCISRSIYDTGVVPTVDSTIVTLSTCTHGGGNSRWVVQGVLG